MPTDGSATGVLVIIPARMGSTRFPGKVLADETGKPLIEHVYEAAMRAGSVDQVVVATDDATVADAVERFGGRVVMTRADHPNGTSRLSEAAGVLDVPRDRIIVNVQGDEPELDPALIDAAAGALTDSGADVATIASPFGEDEDPADPNIVKVVLAGDGSALYFSRALIPHAGDAGGQVRPLKHVGLYAYRRSFLDRYVALPETPLERTERLEQLRVLEHGHRIAVAVRRADHHGIDTPEQYRAFVARWNRRHEA